MRSKIIALYAFGLMSFLATAKVHADSISYGYEIQASSDSQSLPAVPLSLFEVHGFDSSLGALTSTSVWLPFDVQLGVDGYSSTYTEDYPFGIAAVGDVEFGIFKRDPDQLNFPYDFPLMRVGVGHVFDQILPSNESFSFRSPIYHLADSRAADYLANQPEAGSWFFGVNMNPYYNQPLHYWSDSGLT